MGYFQTAPQGTQFTRATSGVFIPEIWLTDIIARRDNKLIAKECTSPVNFNGIKGDTIRVPYVSDVRVDDKVSGVPVTYQSYTDTDWTMRVDRFKNVALGFDRLLELQVNQDLRAPYMERAGFALARDMDNAVLAERATINGYNSGSNVVTTATPLALADIISALEILEEANVDISMCKLLVSPKQFYSLMGQTAAPNINNFDFSATRPLDSGNIPRVLGVPMMVTNQITKNSLTGYRNGEDGILQPTPGVTGSPYFPTQSPEVRGTTVTASALTVNYHTAMITHPEWCKMATLAMPRIESEWNKDYQEYQMVITDIYDVKAFRPDHAVIINSDETGEI